MSIQLPKYTISTEVQNQPKNPILVILISLLIGLLFGFFSYKFYTTNSLTNLQASNEILDRINKENTEKINSLEAEVSILRTENKVKNQALRDLQQNYKNVIDLNNNLQADVAFYERLLSPNVKNKGLRVFQSELIKQKDNNYLLKLFLVQKIERAREISGKYEIYIKGQQNNTAKSLQISLKTKTNFKFKYFHKVSLPFSLPNGFKAEELVVKLFPKNNNKKTIEYTVDWQTLLNQE